MRVLHKSASLVISAFIALALSLALPGIASAHAVKVSSDPGENAVLSGPPAQVSATFNEPLQKRFAAITIIGPDGKTDQWQSGDPVVSGATISVGMKSTAPAGKYAVNFRVISEDGHPVDGSWPFTITASGAPASAAAPTASQQPSATAASTPANTTDGEMPMWPFVVAVVVSVGAALIWTQRRQS
ncbi:copper resistance protein CopC [Mycobacterium sp. CBMA271]|uniref:copper resistance CopC family protein n=1 Tax=unclassified Mycobacteroides TaxID=2618759 RepID=UPI0012DE83BA|nr:MULTISPECIES: copper resistance CopC family protein [unclassified Mycobacteroides]MUM18065.1 copper resistance protein CopC [Mycobacteroides sp. CBMA 326]MUM23451.1 copper resistance protein CopC [Mycobacteroides sp. CBMA 271]